MKRISVGDSFRGQNYGGLKLPKLKGHVKIRLHNPITGKTETIEGHNIQTLGLEDIFMANYLGSINYGSLLSIAEKWFGGCLLYHDAFPTVTIDGNVVPDPTDYFPQGDDVNTLIAHAGDEAPASAAIVNEDLKRGSPVDITRTSNSIKYTWDWTTRQGNGVISALALTHKDTGNAGIGNTSSAFRNFEPFASIGNLAQVPVSISSDNNLFTKYDDNHGLWFHIGEENEFYSGHTNFQTKKLTVVIKRLPYSKVGLFETMSALHNYQTVFTVELTNDLYLQPAYYFDYENKELWIFNNVTSVMDYVESYNNHIINYAIIDCENQVVKSEGTIESDTNDIAPLSMTHVPRAGFVDRYRNANIIKDGNWLFFPTTNGVNWGAASENDYGQNVKGLKAINFSNQSDQKVISFNDVQAHFRSSVKNGGIILNGGRVVNGSVGYTCANNFLTDTQSREFMGVWSFSNPDKVSNLVLPIGSGNPQGVVNMNRYILASKLIHTTKFNLPTSIEKTATQAMSLEYTLTEE